MKVRALTQGQYKGRIYLAGETFEVNDPKLIGRWMEKVQEKPVSLLRPWEKRTEPRDPGEHDQNVAKAKGWV